MNLYRLNIYKPNNRVETAASFTSGSPFQPLTKGDVLQPSDSMQLDRSVQITSVEHNIFETEKQGGFNDGIRHEIHVFTAAVLQ